jgi:uncharacterized membrane protein
MKQRLLNKLNHLDNRVKLTCITVIMICFFVACLLSIISAFVNRKQLMQLPARIDTIN